MVLHSQCILLAVLTVVATVFRIRSAYVLMIAVLFYLVPLVVNTLSGLYRRGEKVWDFLRDIAFQKVRVLFFSGYQWAVVVVVCQIPAFMYITYMSCTFFVSLIPMMGRFGSERNPDLIIGGVSTLTALLSLGYIVSISSLWY